MAALQDSEVAASSRSPSLIFSPVLVSPRQPPQRLLGLETPLLFRPHLVGAHFSEDAVLLSDVLSCWPLHLAAPGSSLSCPTDYPFLMLLVFGCWLFLVVKNWELLLILSSLTSGTPHQLTSRLQTIRYISSQSRGLYHPIWYGADS